MNRLEFMRYLHSQQRAKIRRRPDGTTRKYLTVARIFSTNRNNFDNVQNAVKTGSISKKAMTNTLYRIKKLLNRNWGNNNNLYRY